MEKINLSKDEKEILEILQKYGEGYIVGGYVSCLLYTSRCV